MHSAIEDFSQDFALIIQRFLKLKDWRDTERTAIGGGFRASHIGELVTGRTTVILKGEDVAIELAPIHSHPDKPGLIGAVHLAPAWMLHAFDARAGGGHRRNQYLCRSGAAQSQGARAIYRRSGERPTPSGGPRDRRMRL